MWRDLRVILGDLVLELLQKSDLLSIYFLEVGGILGNLEKKVYYENK